MRVIYSLLISFLLIISAVPAVYAAVPLQAAASGEAIEATFGTADSVSVAAPAQWLPNEADQTPAVVTEPLSSLEKTDAASDLALLESQANVTVPRPGSIDQAVYYAQQLEKELPNAGTIPLFDELKTNTPNSSAYITAARSMRKLALTSHANIKKAPRAARALVLLTDELVRLTHHRLQQPGPRIIVYRNAIQIYASAGAYRRAAGVARLASAAGNLTNLDQDAARLADKLNTAKTSLKKNTSSAAVKTSPKTTPKTIARKTAAAVKTALKQKQPSTSSALQTTRTPSLAVPPIPSPTGSNDGPVVTPPTSPEVPVPSAPIVP